MNQMHYLLPALQISPLILFAIFLYQQFPCQWPQKNIALFTFYVSNFCFYFGEYFSLEFQPWIIISAPEILDENVTRV
jgi:hypothetical protein